MKKYLEDGCPSCYNLSFSREIDGIDVKATITYHFYDGSKINKELKTSPLKKEYMIFFEQLSNADEKCLALTQYLHHVKNLKGAKFITTVSYEDARENLRRLIPDFFKKCNKPT